MFIWRRHQNLHRFFSGSPPGPEVVYWAISSYRYWASQMAPLLHLQIASLPEWADALNRRRARLEIRKSFPSQLLPSSCRWCEQQTSKHFTRDHCRHRFPCKPDQARHPLGILWDIFRSHPKLPEEQRITKVREFSHYQSDAVQRYSSIITQYCHSLFRYKTCDYGHLQLSSLKKSTTYGAAGLSLFFHLPHGSSHHVLLVVVDLVNHTFSMTEELVKRLWHWAINQLLAISSPPKMCAGAQSIPLPSRLMRMLCDNWNYRINSYFLLREIVC